MTIQRFNAGVMIDLDDADYVARALDQFVALMAERRDGNGAPAPLRPTPRLEQITAKLRAATGSPTAANGRNPTFQSNSSDDAGHAVITCAEAARILGVGARNVRDLAKRGTLRARRAGGRWHIDAMAVAELVERRQG
jgi:excisionase family DNA binding protein